MLLRSFFIGVILTSALSFANSNILYPTFQKSMLRESPHTSNKYNKANEHLVNFFTNLYQNNITLANNTTSDIRIPKIIHQIWLGGSVPSRYHNWMKGWASLQGWDYKLWTDEDVRSFPLHNQDIYDRSENYGEKADILRLELLQRFGGLYVDVDCECIHPEVFEELHTNYDLYIGFEPIEHGFIQKEKFFKLCNAVMASIPKHPLIKHLITNLRSNYLAYTHTHGPVETTGPSFLTRIVCGYERSKVDTYRNMYLPSTFFYPFTEEELEKQDSLSPPPETACIHYWSGSWRKNHASYTE